MKPICKLADIKSIWSSFKGKIYVELNNRTITTYQELVFKDGVLYEKINEPVK